MGISKLCTKCGRTEADGAMFVWQKSSRNRAARWSSWCGDCCRLSAQKSGSIRRYAQRWRAEHPELARLKQLANQQAEIVRNRISRKQATKWKVPITQYEIAVAMSPHLSVALAALWLGRTIRSITSIRHKYKKGIILQP